MNAISGDDDVGGGAPAVGKCKDRLLVVLLEADAFVIGCDDVAGQPINEHCQQIGTVHAVELDLVGELGGPHRGDVGAVRAQKLRIEPARAAPDQSVTQSKLAEHADAVGLQGDAGADLGQGGRLFVDVHLHTSLKQGIGSSAAADAAADDGHTQWMLDHGNRRRCWQRLPTREP